MEDPATWKEIFTTVGPWGVVAVAMGLFLWRIFVWVKPLGERVVARHLQFVDSLDEKVSQLVRSSATDTEGHAKTHGKLDTIHEDVRSIKSRIERNQG